MARITMNTFIIAEAGVNHNGDLALAKRLIDAGAACGADAVKFQTFQADQVVTRQAPKAEYQTKTTGTSESQLDMIRVLQLDEAAHLELIDHARQRAVTFLSTPFDLPSLEFLTTRCGLRTIKTPSGEITHPPYLLAVARASQHVILSTGMSTLAEVEAALGILAFGFVAAAGSSPNPGDFEKAFVSTAGQKALRQRVTLLHCTTEYPAPYGEVNLRALDTLSTAFGLPVGYSDHTLGCHVSTAAVARGAVVIETHLTLDRNLPGPDHKASLEPAEFQALIRQIREVEYALGDGGKRPTESEWKNRAIARKSLVAATMIRAGEVFTRDNLTCKRPGSGVSAARWYEMLGVVASRDYAPDDLIEVHNGSRAEE